MSEKLCEGCGSIFLPSVKYQRFCAKTCWYKKRYVTHREQIRASQKEYYREHTQEIIVYGKKWREARDKIRPWAPLLGTARYRAKKENLPFDLTQEWALKNWDGSCALSKLPFVLNRKRSLFSPTIDKITPALGYVQSNCRFVLFAVNALKYNGTDAEMFTVANALIANIPKSVEGILSLPG